MTDLCRADRDLLDLWAVHGIPDDRGTRDYALDVLMRLWAEHKALRAEVGQLGSQSTGVTP